MGGTRGSISTARKRRAAARIVKRAHHLVGLRFGAAIYRIPAWDMLLDLYVNDCRKSMSLTSLCDGSDRPQRTAFRSIGALVRQKWLIRSPDPHDGRRINVRLSTKATKLMHLYCDDLRALLQLD